MKGFELKFNDHLVTASIKDGNTAIILSKFDEELHLNFSGLDLDTNQHLTWFESPINENDKIIIKIVDVNNSSEVIKSRPNERDPIERKLMQYKELKQYLEKEGLIEKED